MKKIISLILAALLLISFAAVSAESAVGYTPADVLVWFDVDDEGAANVTEQSVNAAFRVVENLVYVASLNADEGQLEALQGILDAITDLRSNQDVTAEQQLGIGCVHIMQTLIVLCNESDPQGVYADQLQDIIDSYNELDATVDTPEVQAVNALYSSIKLAAMVVEECCTSQDQIDQIEAGLTELDAENEAAQNVYEQMVVGAKWLRKLLGAFAKLNNSNCIETIEQEMTLREALIADNDMGPQESLFQYLASSMYALAIFTGDYTIE